MYDVIMHSVGHLSYMIVSIWFHSLVQLATSAPPYYFHLDRTYRLVDPTINCCRTRQESNLLFQCRHTGPSSLLLTPLGFYIVASMVFGTCFLVKMTLRLHASPFSGYGPLKPRGFPTVRDSNPPLSVQPYGVLTLPIFFTFQRTYTD